MTTIMSWKLGTLLFAEKNKDKCLADKETDQKCCTQSKKTKFREQGISYCYSLTR